MNKFSRAAAFMALLATIGVVKAAQPADCPAVVNHVLSFQYNAAGGGGAANGAGAARTVVQAAAAFINVLPYQALAADLVNLKRWLANPECVEKITAAGLNKIVQTVNNRGILRPILVNHNAVKFIKPEAIGAWTITDAHLQDLDIVQFMTPAQIKKLKAGQLNNNIIGAGVNGLTREQVAAINVDNNGTAAEWAGKANFMAKLSPEQFRKLFKSPGACNHLTHALLQNLPADVFNEIDGKCFEKITGLEAQAAVYWEPVLSKLPIKALSRMPPASMHDDFYQLLKASHIAALDSEKSGSTDERCSKVKANHLKLHLVGHLDKTCLKGALGQADINDRSSFLRHASPNVLDAVDDAAHTKKILDANGEVLYYIQKEQFQHLIKLASKDKDNNAAEVCQNFKLAENTGMRFQWASLLTPACFKHIPLAAQQLLIKYYANMLPADILTQVEDSNEFVELLPHIANANPKLLAKLGDSGSICASITFEKLESKEFRHVARHLSDKCLESIDGLKTSLNFSNLHKFPKNVRAMINVEQLLANTEWEQVDTEKWKGMNTPEVCARMELSNLNAFSNDIAFGDSLTAECVNEWKFIGDLTEGQVQSFRTDLLGKLGANTVGKIVKHLRPEQVGALRGNISGAGSVFEVLTVTQVGGLTPEALASISAAHFEKMTDEKFVAVPGKALAKSTLGQIMAIPKDVRVKVSAEQATNLPVATYAAFKDCHDEIEDIKAREIIKPEAAAPAA